MDKKEKKEKHCPFISNIAQVIHPFTQQPMLQALTSPCIKEECIFYNYETGYCHLLETAKAIKTFTTIELQKT